MAERNEIAHRLRQELEPTAPDVWPRIERALELRRIGRQFLGTLPHVPSPGSRLAWEARARVERQLLRKVA